MFNNKKKIVPCEVPVKQEIARNIGFMTVEMPLSANKEKTDELYKMVQQRMDSEMKRLNLEMEWVVLPSIVKNVQIITVKEER